MRIDALMVGAVLCCVAPVEAGLLYTVRTNDDMLRSFDTQSLLFTDIGPLNATFDFGGLAWDSSRNTMFMVSGFANTNLYTVDLADGSSSLVGSHGFGDMFGLTYDPTTDLLYGSRSTTGTGFYALDRDDATASFIGDPGVNLDGLAYDSRRDQVVGGLAGPGDLFAIDRNDGSATLLYDGAFFDNAGLAYDPDTDLLWMIDWGGNMFTFDPNNGYQRSIVLSGLGSHDGLEFVSVPAPGAITLLGLVALGGPRRRR